MASTQYELRPASAEESTLFYTPAKELDEELARKEGIVGRVSFVNGETFSYTDGDEYVAAVREELPYRATTGSRFETITDNPEVRKAVDDVVYDLYGEENPRPLEDYENAPQEGMTMGGMSL